MSKPIAIVVGVGAELGLGAALCRRFAAEGHHVFVAGRTRGKDRARRGHDPQQGRQRRARGDGHDTRAGCRQAVRPRDEPWRRIGARRPRGLQRGQQPQAGFPRNVRRDVRGFLAHRLLRRLPGRTRSGPPARPAGARHRAVHRRFGEHARQAGLCAFRRRQSRPADDRSKHGSRVRPAGHSRRARSHRRRHRRRAPAPRASSNYRANAARTDCSASRRSPTRSGTSTASRNRHGRRKSTCARSRSRSSTSHPLP